MKIRSEFTDAKLEWTLCPLCGGGSSLPLHSFLPFQVVKCNNCQLVYLNPRVNEQAIKPLYSGETYYTEYSGDIGYSIQEKSLRKTFRQLLQCMEDRSLTGGKLLEIGCGYGYFLDEAKSHFSYRAGTDLCPQAVERAIRYADDVYLGGIENLPDFVPGFDCVVACNVIEHIYNPNEFIKFIRQKIAPNGTLIITTPNIGGGWYKFLKSKWPFFAIPEHVCLYNFSTLKHLLVSNGYKNIEIFEYVHAWPVYVLLSKMRLKRLGKYIPVTIGKLTVFIPGTFLACIARI